MMASGPLFELPLPGDCNGDLCPPRLAGECHRATIHANDDEQPDN
jgi:hypothetical protein